MTSDFNPEGVKKIMNDLEKSYSKLDQVDKLSEIKRKVDETKKATSETIMKVINHQDNMQVNKKFIKNKGIANYI